MWRRIPLFNDSLFPGGCWWCKNNHADNTSTRALCIETQVFFFPFFFLFFLLSSFFFLLSSASCFLLPVFSFIGREKIAFYLTVIGAYIHLACTTVQASFATYEAGPSCNEECLAAQKHLVDEICDLGKAFGATGVLMALSAILGGVTTVMVCIGFCNNKKEEIVVQAVVVLPTAIAPIEYTNAKQWS